jgi:hypothetical protein
MLGAPITKHLLSTPNPALSELRFDRPMGGTEFLIPEISKYQDLIHTLTRVGRPEEQYLSDQETEGRMIGLKDGDKAFEFFISIKDFLNASPYLIFNPDIGEKQMEDIRRQMEQDKAYPEFNPIPSGIYESSKLRMNNIQSAVKAAEFLLNFSAPLVATLLGNDPTLNEAYILERSKEVQMLWKKERQGKQSQSDEFLELPWSEIYQITNEMKEHFEKVATGQASGPYYFNGVPLDEEKMDKYQQLRWADENSCNFNIDRKVIFIRESLVPWLRKILAISEVYVDLAQENNFIISDTDGIEFMLKQRLKDSKTSDAD